MYNCRLIILFVCAFLVVHCALGQQKKQYFFRHISQADGLSHNHVFSIAQDPKGFIWIATFNGLQRYDGSRFIYYPDILSEPAGKLTGMTNMFADKENDLLWIVKYNDIEKMKFSNNHFSFYNTPESTKNSSFKPAIFTDVHNEQWLLTGNEKNYIKTISHKNDLISISILPDRFHQNAFITSDSAGNYWAPMGHRLFMFDKKNSKINSDEYNPQQHPLLQSSLFGKNILRFVMTDSNQNIWITTWGDIFYKYDHATKKITTYSLSAIKSKETIIKATDAGLLINCMMEDDNHTIWVGTENTGLLRYNEAMDLFDFCIAEESKKESIQYNYKIFSLFQDRQRNIWIGTDKGISIFNPYRQAFRVIKHEENNPFSISKNEIQSFIQTSNGDMFLGTWGAGIAVYDSTFNFKKTIFFTGPHEKNYAWSFLQVDHKTTWIGCQRGYLVIYDNITGAEQTLRPPELQGRTIRSMEKDSEGNIWCGLQNGMIIKWEKRTGKFLPNIKDEQPGSSPTVSVSNIFIDKSQHCWVSTMDGFKEFDLQKRIFVHTWSPDKMDSNSISGKSCLGIEEYNDTTLLIGTIYGGLNSFNKKTKRFTRLNIQNGYSPNTIYAIKTDTAGYIWITSDYGLYKFNPAENKIIPYGMEAGIINASFVATKFYPLLDGQLLSFTPAEAISFSPKDASYRYNLQTKTEITGFKLFGKPFDIDSLLNENRPVNLSYEENFFSIEFASLDFLNLQQTNYYYKLNGVDRDWVDGGTKRFANYTGMKPGEYTFNVKAENGNQPGGITSFNITIHPPFWQTNWFRLLVILTVTTIIYLLFKKRVNGIRREAALKQHIAETEMMALRAQMNPHFIFNCINSIDAMIQSNDKYQATVYLNKFAKLIRNILDSSKQNSVTLSKDIETLHLYLDLEKFRNENKFTVELHADKELLLDDYKIPPLIIQPYVENAIIHGLKNRLDNNGRLSIVVRRLNNRIHFKIEDNGVGRKLTGFSRQEEKRSYGMQISSDRIKLFNKEENASVFITDLEENGRAVGTKVDVFLNI